jgi:hypothetical protein
MKRSILFIFLIIISISIMGMVKNDPGIKFSHKFHAEEVGAGCEDCHAASDSESPADNMIPDHDNCFSCHDEDETACGYCHTNEDDPSGTTHITTYIAKFSHAMHTGIDFECATCHAGIENSETAEAEHLPSMSLCQTCHTDIERESYCLDCHNAGEKLAPMDHQLDWKQAHGLSSQLENNCDMCHAESQCLACHTGDNLNREVHPLNYVNNHAIDAKNKQDNCYTCHEEMESCVSCHRDQLVMPRNHNTAGWSNTSSGGRHARAAKMDFDNCLACHNDNYGEPVCAQCHVAE